MMKPFPLLLLGLLLSPAFLQALELASVPAYCPTAQQARLEAQREQLQSRWDQFLARKAEYVRAFTGTQVGTPKAAAALQRKQELKLEADAIVDEADQFNAEIALIPRPPPENPARRGQRIVEGMKLLARQLGWSKEKQARLVQALGNLDFDGEPATVADIQHAWVDIKARGQDQALMAEAAAGAGPSLSSAGLQTSFSDCGVFALANAAQLPYGVVAARANQLLREGNWRSAAERANPESVFEHGGLNGGEVIMLAEIFGQGEVVGSDAFAATLRGGRSVMINVVPSDGRGGHEVVLSRTFNHGGETWYEMINSTQDPSARLYLSEHELGIVLQERGVTFRPEPGTTVKPLR